MVSVLPFSRRDLVDRGFVGFVPFSDEKLNDVPHEAGVYVLLRENDGRPTFLNESTGGHFKRNNPTVPVSVLESQWSDGAHCVYVGKAKKSPSTGLRRRLRDFRRYGNGLPVGHQGGRYVWQLADVDEIVVAWKVIDGAPDRYESALISEFDSAYGRRPFANLKG